MRGLGKAGWARFPADERSRAWAAAARKAALLASSDPKNAHWLRCERTWFAGVSVLDTAPEGAVAGVELAGPALDRIRDEGSWPRRWDRAQVSVVYPGYPRPREGEGPAAARYRRARDAAHVDGLLPVGPGRRRMVRDFHGFILGLPLSEAAPAAAPFVVWEGSHLIMWQAFRSVLAPVPPEFWPETDLTEAYHAARRQVFEVCRRVTVHAAPGEAYIAHRLSLHGVAPWADGAEAEACGRMIAYFRPAIAPEAWLHDP